MKKLIKHGNLAAALLVGIALSLGAQPGLPQDNTGGTNYNSGETNHWYGHHGKHGQWRAMRQELAEETKTQDAELEQLLTQMTNAAPAQKLDAVAAVVSKLAED